MIAPLNQGQLGPLVSPFPPLARIAPDGLGGPSWTFRPSPLLGSLSARKSPISTGLCDSGGFSTTICHTPTGPFFDYLPYPPPRFFDYLPYPYK